MHPWAEGVGGSGLIRRAHVPSTYTPAERDLGNRRMALNPSAEEDTPRAFSRQRSLSHGPPAISRSFSTVRQLRMVLVVDSFVSKYSFVSLLRPTPFGQRR